MSLIAGVYEWARDRFAHFRDPIGYWRAKGATIGSGCRLIGCDLGSEPYLVTLGDRVSATDTAFVTHDGGVWVLREEDEFRNADLLAPITVGDNVFLGSGCLIMPGVTIGSNAVVGARSLVLQDVPDGSIVAGVPARVLRTVDEYREKARERATPTAHLDRPAKRAWIERHGLPGA
jgi:acetyltransferase-like isoleucine patch superfamily enzyme